MSHHPDDKIRAHLKVIIQELADSGGNMYEDVFSKGVHYRVKMKLRRIIKEAHDILFKTQ